MLSNLSVLRTVVFPPAWPTLLRHNKLFFCNFLYNLYLQSLCYFSAIVHKTTSLIPIRAVIAPVMKIGLSFMDCP